jgi:hypothetical protein
MMNSVVLFRILEVLCSNLVPGAVYPLWGASGLPQFLQYLKLSHENFQPNIIQFSNHATIQR